MASIIIENPNDGSPLIEFADDSDNFTVVESFLKEEMLENEREQNVEIYNAMMEGIETILLMLAGRGLVDLKSKEIRHALLDAMGSCVEWSAHNECSYSTSNK